MQKVSSEDKTSGKGAQAKRRGVSLLQAFVQALGAWRRCKGGQGAPGWEARWNAYIEVLERELPHGSGLDNKVKFVREKCNSRRVVIAADFHHMNGDGFYTGWTDHEIIVTATHDGPDIRVTGRNRNDIKDYLAETFGHALQEKAPDYYWSETSQGD